LPLFRSEPMRVHLDGVIPDGPIEIRWNGAPVTARREAGGLGFSLDQRQVRHQVNQLDLVLPAGSKLAGVRLQPPGTDPDFHGPPWRRR